MGTRRERGDGLRTPGRGERSRRLRPRSDRRRRYGLYLCVRRRSSARRAPGAAVPRPGEAPDDGSAGAGESGGVLRRNGGDGHARAASARARRGGVREGAFGGLISTGIWAGLFFSLVCGLLVWRHRFYVNADGVSYLDLSDCIVEGRLADVVTTHWSPAYPVLVGLFRLLAPSRAAERSVIRLLTFGSFVLAWLSFERLFSVWLAGRHDRAVRARPIYVLSCCLALWASTDLLEPAYLTPDPLLSSVLLVSGTEALTLQSHWSAWRLARVGTLLGFGYLLKMVVFPIAILTVAIVSVCGFRRRETWAGLAVALPFLVLSLPWICAVSRKAQRPTFGEAGRHAWLLFVRASRPQPTGDRPRITAVQLPDRGGQVRLLDYANEPGTYPRWFDPGAWYGRIPLELSPSRVFKNACRQLVDVARICTPGLGPIALGISAAAWLALRRDPLRGSRVILMLPLAFGVGLLVLVHVEGRLLAPLFAPLVICPLLWWAEQPAADSVVRTLGLVGALSCGLLLTIRAEEAIRAFPSGDSVGSTARDLGRAGGERATVATLEDGYDAYWVRLAGGRITAEIEETPVSFAAETASDRRVVLEHVARLGAVGVIGPFDRCSSGSGLVLGDHGAMFWATPK